MLKEHTVAIATDESGDADVDLGVAASGTIHAIKYEPGTIDTGATLTITGKTTGVPVLTKANAGTADVWYYPAAPCNKVADGAASTISERPVRLFEEQLNVVVASGGATKAGAITLYIDED